MGMSSIEGDYGNPIRPMENEDHASFFKEGLVNENSEPLKRAVERVHGA